MMHIKLFTLRYLIAFAFLFCFLPLGATGVDVELEQELERYIQLIDDNKEAEAGDLLQQLKLSYGNANNPAVASKARLLGYLITDSYYKTDIDVKNEAETDALLQQMLQLTEVTDNPNVLTEIYATELELLLFQNKLDDAILKADVLVDLLPHTTDLRIAYFGHNVLGRLYRADTQYELALQHFISGMDVITQTNDKFTLRRRAFLNFNMARVHAELKNWSQAKQLTEQLVRDAIKYQHLDMLPNFYLLLGYIAGIEQRLEDAIQFDTLGLEAALANGNKRLALTFENNLAVSHIDLKQIEQAKTILERAKQRAISIGNEYSRQLSLLNLGYIRVLEGEHDAGIEQIKASMDYFRQHATKVDFESYYDSLSDAYAVAGRYQEQADLLLERMALREDIRTTVREARLNELQNRYDTKAKAQQITILEHENTLKAQLLENQQLQQKLTLLFVILMLFAAVALYSLYRKVRQSNKKLSETNQQLAIQSQRDPLTGLYNRRALHEHMEVRSKKRRENDSESTLTGILMLDIDFFKRINDHYGHSAGDAVLIEVSKRLLESCREQDLVVRWGGEEILLLLDNISLEKVPIFIKRILNKLAEAPVQYEQHRINVSVSGGFIHLPFANISEQELDWEKVMQISDMALYRSKANGRNQVCMINGLNVNFATAETLLYTDLTGAIREGLIDVATVTGPGGNVN
ncbi:diguanylate cyclase [Rheinheimera sp. MMS21-TC3]|uniref:tetratricopeptide repeat-containing diguanylate cyclase n=1 Tax=Rheinheimera sp. MMS21-TC3 TaxID=3072790 RepID=UPI0028C4555B|nr:diguanylate cyclase [Rheinheimera sp. MMS21-TC3]WNO62234.1 diguanylate cyclase [Rheinheimera sp. MMS21-TC3]